MCGRFTQAMSWKQLVELYRIHDQQPLPMAPRWNVAPTQMIAAVRLSRSGEREAFQGRWGLVPAWAKDIAIGTRMINARSEGVADKNAFRGPFRRHRCLIPADGFYEWTGPRSARQPHYIYATDGALLALAGLWDAWQDPQSPDAPPLVTCTILTTAASPDIVTLHDRMPVILQQDVWEAWLEPKTPLPVLQSLLEPAPAGTLSHHAVTRSVGDPRNEGAELITPLTALH